MPLFWKKSAGQSFNIQRPNSSPHGSPVKTPKGNVSNGDQHQPPLPQHELSTSEALSGRHLTRKSRLSQTLNDVVTDNSARSQFIQFLDSRDSSHLLQFWLDAESFQASAKTRLCSINSRQKEENKGNSISHRANGSVNERAEARFESQSVNDSVLNSGHTNSGNYRHFETLQERLFRSIEEDAVKIFSRYIAKDAINAVGVPDAIRDEVTGRICLENKMVDPECFVCAQLYIMKILESEFFAEFLKSVPYCKHQISVLTSGKIDMEDILYCESALSYFMEFLEQEGERSLLEFYLSADNFSQHLLTNENQSATQAQDDAMIFYDKYFSLQATCSLGFSDKVRFEIEENICREGGPLPSCFETPLRIILTYFEKTYFYQFLRSPHFIKFLTDLVNAVQISSRERKCSGTGSDIGSEHSHDSQLDLMGKDSSRPGTPSRQFVKKFHNRDMRIDTEQFNPDNIWRRPLSGKLNVGYVNELGQFITEFEPEPDRKSESVLAKAMKKLVYKEEDKNKEDLAIQVAQMIIQEVTSVTMSDFSGSGSGAKT